MLNPQTAPFGKGIGNLNSCKTSSEKGRSIESPERGKATPQHIRGSRATSLCSGSTAPWVCVDGTTAPSQDSTNPPPRHYITYIH